MRIDKEEWLRRYLDDELNDEEERQALKVIADDPELRALLKFDIGLRQELASDAWAGSQSTAGTPSSAKMTPGSLPEGFADGVMQAIDRKETTKETARPASTREEETARPASTREEETARPASSREEETARSASSREERETAGKRGMVQRLWQPRPVMLRPVWSAGIAAALLILFVLTPVMFLSLQDEAEPVRMPVRQIVKEQHDRVLMRFVYVDRDAESVAVAGDFSDWEPITLTRQNINGDVAWTGIIPLERGQHRYMFLKDGDQWATDPLANRYVDDGFGNKNAVVNL